MTQLSRKPFLVLALVATVAAFCGACFSAKPIYYTDDKAVALKAIDKVHQLYNDEKYEEILTMFLKKQESNPGERDRFLFAMKKNRAERGKIIGYQETKYQITPKASFRELLFMLRTEFEKGTYEEGVVVLVDGDTAVLDGYFQTDGPPKPDNGQSNQ